MQNNLYKNWWILIFIAPMLLILLFHFCLAISAYLGFSFNVQGLTVKEWFLFMGSYLGGSLTLVGVMLTIRHAQNTHFHQLEIARIEKERDVITNAISRINIYEPKVILKSLHTISKDFRKTNIYDYTALLNRVREQQKEIYAIRVQVMISTQIMNGSISCATCKSPCALKVILPEISKIFDEVTSTLYSSFEKLNEVICILLENVDVNERIRQMQSSVNEIGQPINTTEDIDKELKKLKDITKVSDELFVLCNKCSEYNNKEIHQMITLTKDYIFTKLDNSRKRCIENKNLGER